MNKERFTGQEKTLSLIKAGFTELSKGKGSIITVAGESGFGKTYLLNYLHENLSKNYNVISLLSECQPPIGDFKIGAIQPLYPFARAVENLIERKHLSPEKKLAINMVMTSLAAIPIAGEVFYAAKEIGRDWRQFKREKSSMTAKKVSSAAADYYDTLRSYSDKSPLLLLIDEMHWADPQSVELLHLLAENIETIPMLLVLSFRKSILDAQGTPLLAFLQKYESMVGNVISTELEAFTPEDLKKCASNYIDNYKSSKQFDDWLLEHSSGIPGAVIEYLKYFEKNTPFQPDGTISDNFGNTDYMPATYQSAFTEILEKLTEEEKNILAVCSSEGQQFSALVVSHLLNTDVLSAIKKLRSLQNKSGLIRSIGALFRYGVRTTVYEFSQAFYHSFFANSLEYEEHVALHGQISALLKQKYDEAANEEVRRQLAPYIAAHSAEAGDEDTAKTMLLASAEAAEQYGSTEIIKLAYESFLKLNKTKAEQEELSPEAIEFQNIIKKSIAEGADIPQISNGTANGTGSLTASDFQLIRSTIVEEYHKDNYSSAADKALSYFNSHQADLKVSEQAQLLALVIKSYIELKEFENAEKFTSKALTLVKKYNDPIAECFILNSTAVLRISQKKYEEANDLLKRAAQKSFMLPLEMRLLTLSNIAILMKTTAPNKAERYMRVVRKLGSALKFDELMKDITAVE